MSFLSNWKTLIDKALLIFLLVFVSKFKVAMKFRVAEKNVAVKKQYTTSNHYNRFKCNNSCLLTLDDLL